MAQWNQEIHTGLAAKRLVLLVQEIPPWGICLQVFKEALQSHWDIFGGLLHMDSNQLAAFLLVCLHPEIHIDLAARRLVLQVQAKLPLAIFPLESLATHR